LHAGPLTPAAARVRSVTSLISYHLLLLIYFRLVEHLLDVPAKAVQGGDRSNIRPHKDGTDVWLVMTGQNQGRIFDQSPGTFDRWPNLTGHIAYRLFDRLPVKYPVPENFQH